MSEQSETSDGASGGSQCPMCGADLFERHCKYVCPQHGVLYDCADGFWIS